MSAIKEIKYTVLIVCLFLQTISSYAQLSPGGLSRAHKHLEGSTHCVKCHVPNEKETTSRCLACHSELQVRIDKGEGYHAALNVKAVKCAKCHAEHLGETTSITGFDKEKFDHDSTFYPLIGEHKTVDCDGCHKIIEKDGASIQQFKGVKYANCIDCHVDVHNHKFGNDCRKCHSEFSFTQLTRLDSFNHNSTNFPLEGAHLLTPCFACHKTDAEWNFSFGDNSCTQCHVNSHEKVLPDKYMPNNDCESCHAVSVWSDITFDHNQTNYKLLGNHQEVSCRNCHFSESEDKVIQQFTGTGQLCSDCHTDVHFQQFADNDETDCQSCHVLTTWKPEKFEHCSSRFVLDGKHATLPCARCHKPTDDLIQNYIVYKFDNILCSRCH